MCVCVIFTWRREILKEKMIFSLLFTITAEAWRWGVRKLKVRVISHRVSCHHLALFWFPVKAAIGTHLWGNKSYSLPCLEWNTSLYLARASQALKLYWISSHDSIITGKKKVSLPLPLCQGLYISSSFHFFFQLVNSKDFPWQGKYFSVRDRIGFQVQI